MARWLVGWTLLITVLTAGAYFGTNAWVGDRSPDADMLAVLPFTGGGLGTTVCQRAQRAFVDTGAGSDPTASPAERAAWARAARGVLQACADI